MVSRDPTFRHLNAPPPQHEGYDAYPQESDKPAHDRHDSIVARRHIEVPVGVGVGAELLCSPCNQSSNTAGPAVL